MQKKRKDINLKTWLQPKLRQISYQWPERTLAKNAARVSRGLYKCSICKQLFGPKEIVLDHILPIIPVNIPLQHLSLDIYINNLFCKKEGFQVLCKKHHLEKSQKENTERDEWLSKEKFIIYKTTNLINKKIYIGIHKCIDYDDGYLGSGKILKQAIQKYGKSNFIREILFCFDNIEDAIAKEQELVNDEFLDNENVYNLIAGGAYSQNVKESSNKKRITCHQTGETFESISDAAKWLGLECISSISKALNNPNKPVKCFHFFETSKYDPKIKVTFPRDENKCKIVHLNNKTIYNSLKECSETLNFNYKSFRNSAMIKDSHGVFKHKNEYFINENQYDPNVPINITINKILCIELNKKFNTYTEAAEFIGHKNPINGGIAIGKCIREEKNTVYGYTWKNITETIKF